MASSDIEGKPLTLKAAILICSLIAGAISLTMSTLSSYYSLNTRVTVLEERTLSIRDDVKEIKKIVESIAGRQP